MLIKDLLKAELEQISIETAARSFQFFEIKTKVFTPYWHYHPELELTFILKGSGTRFVGDSILPFNDHDLILVGENLPHHWVSVGNENNEEQVAYVFQFKKELFNGFKECRHFTGLFEKAKQGIQFKQINSSLIQMILNFGRKPPIEQLSSFIQIIEALNNNSDQSTLVSTNFVDSLHPRKNDSKISKITNYIVENLHKKLTVNHMSEVSHMVPQSFCRWFKRHSGHSFVSFLNKARIELACQHLITSNMSIQGIAFASGFETLSHFNRTFKKLKSMSPRAFRKESLSRVTTGINITKQ